MELKVIEGGRDEFHEKALYALFDGIRGNRKRMKEADTLFARLYHQAELTPISGLREATQDSPSS